jgi:hypothetical protein
VPGDERPRGRPGGGFLQNGRLDLEKVVVVEEPADPLDDLSPGAEPFPGFGVHQQVEVTAAVAGLDVGDALPLVRQRADRLVQDGELGHRHRPLAAAGGVERAGETDEVADLHGAGPRLDDVRAELIPGQRNLHTPAAVLDVSEDQSAHPAPEDDPAGEADGRPVRRALGVGGHRVGVVAGSGRHRPGLLCRHQLHPLEPAGVPAATIAAASMTTTTRRTHHDGRLTGWPYERGRRPHGGHGQPTDSGRSAAGRARSDLPRGGYGRLRRLGRRRNVRSR